MTLNQELDIPEYKVKLYYHNERRPSEETVKKICESLQLAREISHETSTRLAAVLNGTDKDDSLARTVTEYHFKVNASSAKDFRDKVIEVMSQTAAGLKEGMVTLSDVLSRYWWDLYKVYGRLPEAVRKELSNGRLKGGDQPTADRSRSGYVAIRDLQLKSLKSWSFGLDCHVVTIAGDNKSAQVWDLATGKRIGKPMQHTGVLSAQFSLDGQRVVTKSLRNTVCVWDAATGEAIGQPIQHAGGVYSVQFSPNGQRVVTASADKTARVWNATTGEAIGQPMQHAGDVYSAQFTLDGKRVVTASADGTARVWDAATGEAKGQPMRHGGSVKSAQFSPDGQRVVTASQDGTARVWDAATGQAKGQPMQHGGSVKSARFSPDGQWVVTASSYKVRVWEAETGKAIGKAMQPGEAATGEAIRKAVQPRDEVYSAEFTKDGERVLTTSESNTMQYWDAATGEAIGEPMEADEAHFFGGIHIEFLDVPEYPRLLLAMFIVHEATHKFADTEDHAYTEQDKYKGLTCEKRIDNADSFAYAAISIAKAQLIEDLEEFLKAVPRDDQTGPKTVLDWPMNILGRATTRPQKT